MWMNTFALLMMFFVVSCRSFERELLCNEIDKYQVIETEACIVSIKYNACLCTSNFDVNSWTALEDYRKEPLEYCDGIMGVKRDFALAEIEPNFVALQRLRESSCQNPQRSKTSSKSITTQNLSQDKRSYSHLLDDTNRTSKDDK